MQRALIASTLVLALAGCDSASKGPAQASAAQPDTAKALAPSFSCDGVMAGSIEELICQDPALAALDLKMQDVYSAAAIMAETEQPPTLRAEQRGWIKGRDDCWKSQDKGQCVEDNYRLRIAELQARYRLVAMKGPVTYQCGESPADVATVSFFDTEPATLIAERGDSGSLLDRPRAASGARYQGRNESFWEHQGKATLVWGHQAPVLTCTPVQ